MHSSDTITHQEDDSIRLFAQQSQSLLKALFLIALSIMLMVMDKRIEGFTAIRSVLTVPIAPIQHLVSFPSRFFDSMKALMSSHDVLINENLQLKADQLLLQSKLQRVLALESENKYLKSLLRSTSQTQVNTLIAELLAVSSEPFVNQVVINKGSGDGVYVGQPVLDATGVMGQVMQVGPMTSRVLLVNDPHSGVPVEDARNGVRAVAVGESYSDKLRLLYVPKTADIIVGDTFLTSGLGDYYPEGYPVGKVISVSKDPAHQFASVVLEPSAKLDRSRQVLLVWYKKNA